jgi:4-diphosphocytidyl-2-C-methyl-D-erythritol kinase
MNRSSIPLPQLAQRAGVQKAHASGSRSDCRRWAGRRSSNAAATLLALTKLWQIEIDDRTLFEIAARLDRCAFLPEGHGSASARRRSLSDRIVQLSAIFLVNPGFAVSTRREKLSRLTRSEAALNIPFTLLAAKGINGLPLVARNDLEEAVLAAHPEIAEVKRRLLSLGARHAQMSGSGATVFGVFDNSQAIEQAEAEARAAGYWAQRARTVDAREYQATIFQ